MICVNTPTLEDYLIVIEWALSQGMSWRSGDCSAHRYYWSSYFSKTYIVLSDNNIAFCSLEHAESRYKEYMIDVDKFYSTNNIHSFNTFGMKYNLT